MKEYGGELENIEQDEARQERKNALVRDASERLASETPGEQHRNTRDTRDAQSPESKELLPPTNGFEACDELSDERLAEYLATFPPEHFDALTEIIYIDEAVLTPQGRVVEGKRQPSGPINEGVEHRLELFQPNPRYGEDTEHHIEVTLAHEIGHNAYWTLDEELREQWGTVSKDTSSELAITDYSRTNEKEDFAETYWIYHDSPEYVRDVWPDRYELMKKVFHD